MCTVSIVPLTPGALAAGGGVRLACNRDELRTRTEARPPEILVLGAQRVIAPIDPPSGGTWIGVSDAGIAATLLNVNLARDTRGAAPQQSRGAIVPAVLARGRFADAEHVARSIDPRRFPPFRLVLLTRGRMLDVYSDGAALHCTSTLMDDAPRMFTSSGLGDALVEGPRRELFDRCFAGGDFVAAQHAFHRHSWPDRRPISVCMDRDAARTVSCTRIDLLDDRVVLTYTPGAPDVTDPEPPLALAMCAAGAQAT